MRRNLHLKFFYPSRTLSEQFLVFSQKFLTGLSKLHSICPKEHFETKLHFIGVISPFHFFFGPWAKFFWLAGKKNCRHGDQNCSLPVRRILLMRNASFLKNIFSHFPTLNKTFLACWQKIFGRVIKLAFYLFMRKISGEILLFHGRTNFFHLSGTLSKFSFFFSKDYRRRCQSCIPRVQKNNLRKIIFFEERMFVFFIFGRWEKKISDFWLKNFRQVYQNRIVCP